MFRWLVSVRVGRVAARSRAGDMGPTLALWADDGRFRFQFPGRSSWAIDTSRRDELAAWYERFAQAGLRLHPEEVLVTGPPWRMTACVHFTDTATAPTGETVYENRGVLFFRMKWGKVTFGTVYEDTQKVAEFDEYLIEQELAGSSPGQPG
jgi:ketosteroid isomerase-like protein